MHGGDPGIVNNFAHYAECDVRGQLAKYDRGNNNSLIEYASGALTGNDADAVALQYYTSQISHGNAIGLNGPHPNQSVTLPAGIVSSLTDFTVSTWVNLDATTTWSRVFDFGSGPNTNMFLTVNAGTGPRFAITTAGGGNEQRINPTTPGQLPTNQWIHLAVTLSGNTGTLYVNGVPVGSNPNITLRPSTMGGTTQNWIGKSQYGDPGCPTLSTSSRSTGGRSRRRRSRR